MQIALTTEALHLPGLAYGPTIIRVYSGEQYTVDVPCDPAVADDLAAHESAALRTALAPDPSRDVTLTHQYSDTLGHTFKAEIS